MNTDCPAVILEAKEVDVAPGPGGGKVSDIVKTAVDESDKATPLPLMTRLNRVVGIVTVATHYDDGLPDCHGPLKVVKYSPTDMDATVKVLAEHPRVGTGDVPSK